MWKKWLEFRLAQSFTQIWHYTSTGILSVKSAYRVALNIESFLSLFSGEVFATAINQIEEDQKDFQIDS